MFMKIAATCFMISALFFFATFMLDSLNLNKTVNKIADCTAIITAVSFTACVLSFVTQLIILIWG